MSREHIEFYLNGQLHKIQAEAVFQPLSDYLRYQCQLTGTKVVCAEGDCGACTVLVSRWNPHLSRGFHSTNSCIAMAFLLDGAHIVSVEGLAQDKKLSEVQESMVRNFGGQCGFCTPGFVMALTGLFEEKQTVTEKQVKNYLTGNLCRCTGYAPILQAALDVQPSKVQPLAQRYAQSVSSDVLSKPIHIRYGQKEFYAPTRLQDACAYKKQNPDVVLFSGATDLGVQFNKGRLRPQKFMSLHLIKDLYEARFTNSEFVVGAKATLAEFETLVEKEIPDVKRFLHIFASPQIKNAATLVGNIANASPIADTTPFLMTLDAQLDIQGTQGSRTIALKDLYTGYKKLQLASDEIIAFVRFKKPTAQSFIRNYKISQRRDLDISCVNASFLLETENNKISKARITFGGVGPITQRLLSLENLLQGQPATRTTLEGAKKQIAASIAPISDARGSADYRRLIAESLFEKFMHEALQP